MALNWKLNKAFPKWDNPRWLDPPLKTINNILRRCSTRISSPSGKRGPEVGPGREPEKEVDLRSLSNSVTVEQNR